MPHDIAGSLLPASQHLPAHDGVLESFVERAALCNEANTLSSLSLSASEPAEPEPKGRA